MATWLQERQRAGAEAFQTLGWPTRGLEAWKTTPIKPIVGFGSDPIGSPSPDVLNAAAQAVSTLGEPTGPRLVLVCGEVVDALSTPGDLDTSWAGSEAHLGAIASQDKAPLVALSARALDRAVVLRASQAAGGVVELVHVGVPGAGGAQTRVLVVAETSEEVTLVERFIDVSGDPCWTNVVTEVAVGPNACVRHVQVLAGGRASARTGNLSVRVERDGRFESHVVALGGRIGRSEIMVRLVGSG
ncbi:MAG: SufD family Fe-S cluster assembly protein, partial [Myxococcota bacterium]|nr:SufD family Fe-S cluster assembly protein [Myxococcota bacterium]